MTESEIAPIFLLGTPIESEEEAIIADKNADMAALAMIEHLNKTIQSLK